MSSPSSPQNGVYKESPIPRKAPRAHARASPAVATVERSFPASGEVRTAVAAAGGHRHAGIVVGKATGRRQTHAAAAADHHRCGIRQPEIHGCAPYYQKAYDRYYSSRGKSDTHAYTEVPVVAKQATADKRQRRERGSINPDDIISGAFELAEQVSIDNLSMPLLGKHLGVGVTSIYWYFRKKDDLLNAMTDRALRKYVFATPYVEAKDWRETLRNHARLMRKTFMGNPILCDLILIRAALSPKAARLGAQEMERAIANLVEAGLSPEDAFDTYSAVSVHVRGSVVLHRLYEKNQTPDSGPRAIEDAVAIDPATTPLIAQVTGQGHRIGAPDETNFEFGLECILDHAGRLIEKGAKAPPSGQRKSTKSRTKAAGAR